MIVNLLSVLVWAVIVFIAPFVIWRRIRDEYSDEDVVRLFLLVIFLGITSAVLMDLGWSLIRGGGGLGLFKLDLWGGLVAGLVGTWWFHLDRTRGLTGDVQDAIVEGYWWACALFVLGSGILSFRNISMNQIIWIVLWWAGLSGFYWLRGKYRQFSWYPSGKVGFVFWMTLVVWGAGYVVNGFIFDPLIMAFIKAILGAGLVVVGMIGWYKRSGRKAYKDFGWLPGVSF